MADASPNTTDPNSVMLSTAQIDAGLQSGFKLLDGQFTYSVPTSASTWPGYSAGSEPYSGYVPLTASQATRFAAAVGLMDSYIAPTFTGTNDVSNPGTIRIAFNAQSGGAEAYTYVYGSPLRSLPANASDIWFNTNAASPAATTFDDGTYGWESVLHELGHAVGLKHSFEGTTIPDPYDNTRYTIMSYTAFADSTYVAFSKSGGTLYSQPSTVNASTPMVLDIKALQDLYGADTHTAAGDTRYTFDIGKPFLESIYDASGTDTIDLSGLARGSIVDINPGAYSSIGYWSAADQAAYWKTMYPGFDGFIDAQFGSGTYTWSNNLGIAFSTTIENVVGSSQADTIVGNSVDNVISGGLGADTLTGGGGHDTFRGTVAEQAGDRITDLAVGDRIAVTDLGLSSFAYTRGGAALAFGGVSMNIGTGDLRLVLGADGTGTDLIAANHWAGLADFNGDGHSDILWRNDNGAVTTWGVTGNAHADQVQMGVFNGGAGNDWQIADTFDFNGDGLSDILWRNANGAMTVWAGSGKGGFQLGAFTSTSAGTDWKIAATGDFNGDGRDDILWRNANGSLTEWTGNGSGFTQNAYTHSPVGTDWKVMGAADFNGDGKADILWRNDNGTVDVWTGTGSGFAEGTFVAGVGRDWHVAGLGDLNGDGKDDILWRNDDGAVTAWLSNGSGFTTNQFNAGAGADWTIRAVGDFNDDGKADVIWSNTNGSVTTWQSNGTGFDMGVINTSVGTDWHIASHPDYF